MTDRTEKSPGPRRDRTVSENRVIDFDGPPSDRLPGWARPFNIEGVHVELYPPVEFELAYKIDHYCIFAPFALAPVDLSINDGPVRRTSLPTGGAFLSPPFTTVRVRLVAPVEFLVIAAPPERVEGVIERVGGGRVWSPQVVESFVDPGFAALQLELRRALISDPLMEPAYVLPLVDAMFARFSCHFLDIDLPAGHKETLPPRVLRNIVREIEGAVGSRLSVEDLAKKAGLSRSHFSRAFHAATGETPQDFIISRRLCHARDMLVETERPIAEIAVETGFASHAHFSTAFKKRLGVSPARYRLSFRED